MKTKKWIVIILVVFLQWMSPCVVAQQTKSVNTQSVLFTETRMSQNGMMIFLSEVVYEIEFPTEFMPMNFPNNFSQEFLQNFEPTSEPVVFSWNDFKDDARTVQAKKNLAELQRQIKVLLAQLPYNGPIGLAVIKLD